MVKDAGEVARVRAACAIADDALADIAPDAARTRPTERDFALRLEFAMRERGASGVSFDPIVAVGPERRQAARAAVGPARSCRTSSWSSISAASSTGTAPT